MKKRINFYITDSQLEIVKKYLLDLNGESPSENELAETINAKCYLYGSIGFDNEVKKMKEHLDLMARYESLRA